VTLTDEQRRARNARYARERRARKRNGEVGFFQRVPAEPTRVLIQQALERGATVSLIAEKAGLNRGTVSRALHPDTVQIEVSTERAIKVAVGLAVRTAATTGQVSPARVRVDETRTKLRRLAAAGWPMVTLLKERGIPYTLLRDRAVYTTPDVVEAVDALYEEIGYALGPSLQSARTWRQRGYLVPAADAPEDQLPLPKPKRQEARDRARERVRNARRRERKRALRLIQGGLTNAC
jgi:transposase-like protein